LFVPENAEINMPLIVFLHGDGEVGDVELLEDFGIIRSARQIYGNEFPFIVVSPSTRIYSWIKGNIPATLKGLIDEVASECRVDPERIILTGHSRGSIGTWHMVSTYGNYFSAAVPVSADSEGMLNYDNLTSIPIWTIAGSYDTYYLDNMSSLVYMIRQAGGDIQFTILEDCHHGETSTRAYTQEVFEWMCAQ
jgi:predicted peptidase